MLKEKLNMQRRIQVFGALFLWAVIFVWALFCLNAQAAPEQTVEYGIQYRVDFVDQQDYGQKVFNSQTGIAQEGTVFTVTYPNQIIGSDGCIWKAVLKSPQNFTLFQAGTQKFYVEYQQGEKIMKPEEPEADKKEKLEAWLVKAWKADCEITGQSPEGIRDHSLIMEDDSNNDNRIRNLVSMIDDVKWHYFYLIGKDFIPRTLVIGTSFDAAYSSVKQDVFSIENEKYYVLRVGVCRHYEPETCVHNWERVTAVPESCLINGEETLKCKKCFMTSAVILPALGHIDKNSDSLCDRCGKRVFAQKVGDQIQTSLKTGKGEKKLTFTCLDEDYNKTGLMLYLADEVLGAEITGSCFTDSDYNTSLLRSYFNQAFSNDSSIAAALQPIVRPESGNAADYASIFSKGEYESYKSKVVSVSDGYFLRRMAVDFAETVDSVETIDSAEAVDAVNVVDSEEAVDFALAVDSVHSVDFALSVNSVYAVSSDGELKIVPAAGNKSYGARPFILLERPKTDEKAEPTHWKKGDIQMRPVGRKIYRFRCIDEDYSDNQDGHRKAALFLCDSVIRSDIDSDRTELKKFTFGANNNYKTSDIRVWLQKNNIDSNFNLEPIYIGVNAAYTGSTPAGSWEQLLGNHLRRHEISFQLMQDRMFCLSVEEALKYRHELWRFEAESEQGEHNPESQVSPCSQGYYLRTPFYVIDDAGEFIYSDDIYAVDLVNGNIHTVNTGNGTYGLRPAFALPQE